MTVTTDAVIVGGGVMGTSILYNLAKQGVRSPLLLERETLGSGSTGRSSGLIRMHYSTEVNTRLAWESYKVFKNFDDVVGGDPAFVKCGFIVIAPDEQAGGIAHNTAIQQRVGVPVSLISKDEAQEVAPGFKLNDGETYAWEPESGHADPSGTALAFAQRARELGADVQLESPVTNVEIEGDRVVAVTTATERYETPIVVLATGPWSARFFPKLGIEIPLEATRHEVFFIKRPLDRLPHHPGGADIANLTYFRPEGTDLTLVGNGNVEQEVDPDTYNPKPSMDYLENIWMRLAQRIPDIADGEYFTGYAGLYTSTPDLHPVVDKVEGINGLYVCTGFSGHGFKLSPAIGTCMAQLILEGESKLVDISPLRMSRFTDGDLNGITYDFRVIA